MEGNSSSSSRHEPSDASRANALPSPPTHRHLPRPPLIEPGSSARPLNDHLRSISLPQALHSFSLSNRSPHSKRSAAVAAASATSANSVAESSSLHQHQHEHQQNSAAAEQDRDLSPRSSGSSSAIRTHLGSRIARIFPFGSSQDQAASSSSDRVPKRAISEGHGSAVDGSGLVGPRALGRSRTTPRLSYVLSGEEDTDILAPPPVSARHDSTLESLDECSVFSPFSGQPQGELVGRMSSDADYETQSEAPQWGAAQRALNTPEILRCIFEALDACKVVPHELVQQRRKPLSLRHAQLMFGNTKKAIEALQSNQPTTAPDAPAPGLYNCLFVNSVWYDAAVRVLERQIYFRTSERWLQFARRGAVSLTRKPRKFVLHKLGEAMQVEIDLLDSQNLGEQLEWLEFYTCAGIAPSPSMLGAQLTKIILPGCFRVNDRTMAHIAERCPQLRHLDIRACELVTDRGIKLIAKYCPQLELINIGRTHGGEHITYKGIKHLARQTQLSTLGIAGCHVDDRAVWELALNRGPHLQRLSLNNCVLLSDYGVPKALGYMPNLTVLEIRGCVHITNMKPLVLFKMFRERQGQPPLIEGCEVIERRLQEAINQMHRERNNRIFNDLECWANQNEPEDNRSILVN